MKKSMKKRHMFAALLVSASVLFASTGCSSRTVRNIRDTSAATVAATVLDLTLISALEGIFGANN